MQEIVSMQGSEKVPAAVSHFTIKGAAPALETTFLRWAGLGWAGLLPHDVALHQNLEFHQRSPAKEEDSCGERIWNSLLKLAGQWCT